MGAEFDGFAFLEADPETVDDLALVVQRLGRVDDSVDSRLERHAEALLSRHIGVKIHPLRRRASAAYPNVVLDEFHFDIRSCLAGEVQLRELVLIQFLRVLDHFFVMLVPLGDGVVVLRNSCHGKNSVSEFLKGLFLRQIGEHCFGPIYGRHADDAPLTLVVHGVADQVRHLGVVGHVGCFDLLAVHVGHDAGLVGQDRDVAGAVVVLGLGLVVLPLRHLGQHLRGLVLVCHLGEVVVVPLDGDVFGAGLIGALCDLLHERRVLHMRPDDQGLILLHICAFAHHELRKFIVHLFCNQVVVPPLL